MLIKKFTILVISFITHLFGLYPANQITIAKIIEFAKSTFELSFTWEDCSFTEVKILSKYKN